MKGKKETGTVYNGAERRRYVRFGYPFFVRTKKDGKGSDKNNHPLITFKELEKDEVSIAKNISIGGISFTTSKDYPPGILIYLELFTPTRKTPFNMLARVTWRKKRSLGHSLGYTYDMGVEFLKIDSEGEFQDLLEHLVKSKLEKLLL